MNLGMSLSYTSPVNPLNQQHKYNSLIPLRLLNNSLIWGNIPFALQAITMLEENSHDSAKQVEKIFREFTYRQQQEVQREKLECL